MFQPGVNGKSIKNVYPCISRPDRTIPLTTSELLHKGGWEIPEDEDCIKQWNLDE